MTLKSVLGIRVVVLAALAMGASGCALTFDAHTLAANATVASPPTVQPAGNTFHVSQKAVYLLFGALPASQPSLERVLAGQLINGSGVANLRISVGSRWSDILITVLTAGLIVPRTVTYEGVIVQTP